MEVWRGGGCGRQQVGAEKRCSGGCRRTDKDRERREKEREVSILSERYLRGLLIGREEALLRGVELFQHAVPLILCHPQLFFQLRYVVL